MSDWVGKVAVITGAAHGIGSATAQALAAKGAAVVLADINADGAEAIAADIRAAGGKALSGPVDVRSDASVAALAETVRAQLGPPDLVINNAVSYGPARGTFDSSSLEQWRENLDVNFLGYVRVAKAFLPSLEARRGALVLTASSLTILPNAAVARMAPYSAAKGATLGLAYSLAYDFKARGVTVQLFCPGLTSTAPDGSSQAVDLGLMADVGDDRLKQPGTASGAAAVLVAGIESGRFLISSEPDYEAALVRFASAGLDPFADFH